MADDEHTGDQKDFDLQFCNTIWPGEGVLQQGPLAGSSPLIKKAWPRWFLQKILICCQDSDIGKFQIKSVFPVSSEKSRSGNSWPEFIHDHDVLAGEAAFST